MNLVAKVAAVLVAANPSNSHALVVFGRPVGLTGPTALDAVQRVWTYVMHGLNPGMTDPTAPTPVGVKPILSAVSPLGFGAVYMLSGRPSNDLPLHVGALLNDINEGYGVEVEARLLTMSSLLELAKFGWTGTVVAAGPEVAEKSSEEDIRLAIDEHISDIIACGSEAEPT